MPTPFDKRRCAHPIISTRPWSIHDLGGVSYGRVRIFWRVQRVVVQNRRAVVAFSEKFFRNGDGVVF